ncbi:MAG: hypothetical protein ACI8TP_000557 [Acidimicrobiales bacterium]
MAAAKKRHGHHDQGDGEVKQVIDIGGDECLWPMDCRLHGSLDVDTHRGFDIKEAVGVSKC